jgi:hypothetical protein
VSRVGGNLSGQAVEACAHFAISRKSRHSIFELVSPVGHGIQLVSNLDGGWFGAMGLLTQPFRLSPAEYIFWYPNKVQLQRKRKLNNKIVYDFFSRFILFIF